MPLAADMKRIYVEINGAPDKDKTKVMYFDDRESLNNLLSALNKEGLREHEVFTNINLIKGIRFNSAKGKGDWKVNNSIINKFF